MKIPLLDNIGIGSLSYVFSIVSITDKKSTTKSKSIITEERLEDLVNIVKNYDCIIYTKSRNSTNN
jgi:hypothetical protein